MLHIWVMYIGENGLRQTDENIRAVKLEAHAPTSVTDIRKLLAPCRYERLLWYVYKLLWSFSTFLFYRASTITQFSKTRCLVGMALTTTMCLVGMTLSTKRCFWEMQGTSTECWYLVHYDPLKPVILSCDASPIRTARAGSVLLHRMPNAWSERPVC